VERNSENNISQNIQARKLSEDLIDMGFDLVRESGIDAKATRRFWQYVMESITDLVQDEVVNNNEADSGPMKDEESRRFGSSRWPHGKQWYAGTIVDSVPMVYLEWYVDNSLEFARTVKRYLDSERISGGRR